jgi:alkylated DNA nucleotide flippase Atl1
MKTFSEKVKAIVAKIPKGKTMTYKEVAAKAGNPKAAHRVVKSDGSQHAVRL